jgi:hypothetical protein
MIFPKGTVFMMQRTVRNGSVYSYGTPSGGTGETLFYDGTTPGR